MAYWIKKFARIIGYISFFAVLFASLDYTDPLAFSSLSMALLKAACAASLFWFAGFVIGDMLFKGIVEDIAQDQMDEVGGGILQRAQITKRNTSLRSAGSKGDEEPVSQKTAGT